MRLPFILPIMEGKMRDRVKKILRMHYLNDLREKSHSAQQAERPDCAVRELVLKMPYERAIKAYELARE